MTENSDADASPNGDVWMTAASVLAGALSIFHLYFAYDPLVIGEEGRNLLHFGGFALLVAMTTPLFASGPKALRLFDLLCGLIVFGAAIYMIFYGAAIEISFDDFGPFEWFLTGVLMLGGIEFTRRTTGPIIPILALIAFTFVPWWGAYAPQPFTFNSGSFSWETMVRGVIFDDEGMFGVLANISSTTIFLFIIFGAFLVRSGAGEFVIAFARAVAGRLVGGPGLVAVISSALTGTISGSAVANTASTGVITIPLMKRAGYSPSFAAGVEAAASTGGQLMPPIMGAGAFLMATYTNISYETIIAVAALPALLYFASVAMFVRIEARRAGLGAMEADGATLGQAVRDHGASFLIPIATIVALLVSGFGAALSAVVGVVTVIASSWLTKNPMGPRAIWEALVQGARNMSFMAVLLCTIGILVSAIVKGSIGQKFSFMIADWSGGMVLIAVLLTAIASLVLGMGLPVTAAYIVLATLTAPMLRDLIIDASGAVPAAIAAGEYSGQFMVGILQTLPQFLAPDGAIDLATATAAYDALGPFEKAQLRPYAVSEEVWLSALLSAHMIVFWLSQDSNVTPPVCLAAFTAAAIAKAPPMRTGFQSWKIAKGLYIVPILFAVTPMLSGSWIDALAIFGLGLVGVYGLAGALGGALEAPLSISERIVAGVAGVACLWHGPLMLFGLEIGHLLINSIGVGLVLALLALTIGREPQPQTEARQGT